MTSYKLTEALMTKAVVARCGGDPVDAEPFVRALLDVALAHGLILAERLERHERDAKMYDLRTTEALPVVAIASRFGTHRDTVNEAIKSQLKIRRAG